MARLKEQAGKELVVLGSGELLQSLMWQNLVDRYVLLIHLPFLGSGKRLFADGGPNAVLRLVSARATPTGVVVTINEPVQATAG